MNSRDCSPRNINLAASKTGVEHQRLIPEQTVRDITAKGKVCRQPDFQHGWVQFIPSGNPDCDGFSPSIGQESLMTDRLEIDLGLLIRSIAAVLVAASPPVEGIQAT